MLRKRPAKTASDPARRRGGPRYGALNLGGEPADTGSEAVAAPEVPPQPADPLFAFETLGEALKAVREERGFTLEGLAETTRVRRAYLEAIEEMRLDALPSRPFTIGYIRAYALALGLDPDAAVERFKAEEPVLDEPLRNPIGVPDERDPRVAAFMIGALVIVAAIIFWNVAQRSMLSAAPPPPLAPQAFTDKALRAIKPGEVQLGAPLPAPVESTTPPPYETPGLAAAMGKIDPNAPPTKPKPISEAPAVDPATLPPYFQAKGKVYDAGPSQPASPLTIQALKPASLIVRGADGSVYFARQLSAGDAYRVPNLAGLTLDVSEPRDIQVFVNGQSKGVLPSAQVLAAKLSAPAAAAAAPSEPIKITPPMPVAAAPAAKPAAVKPAAPRPAAKAP